MAAELLLHEILCEAGFLAAFPCLASRDSLLFLVGLRGRCQNRPQSFNMRLFITSRALLKSYTLDFCIVTLANRYSNATSDRASWQDWITSSVKPIHKLRPSRKRHIISPPSPESPKFLNLVARKPERHVRRCHGGNP